MANYISKHTGKQIDAAVDAFLAGGGTGSVEVDTTLTQAGKAADAKATGDRLTALTEEMANKKGLTSAQITALDNMFKVCAYASSADSAYAAFCYAFGITGGGTGGDSGEGSDGVNVYLADYSTWPKWGSGISVVDNGFSVNSPAINYSAGVAVGIFQSGRYGDYKDKTLKISCDIGGEITQVGEGMPLSLSTYSDIPVTGHNEYLTASHFILPYIVEEPRHVEVTLKPSDINWTGATPNDTDYLAIKFYCHLVGNVTITNFRVEVM